MYLYLNLSLKGHTFIAQLTAVLDNERLPKLNDLLAIPWGLISPFFHLISCYF